MRFVHVARYQFLLVGTVILLVTSCAPEVVEEEFRPRESHNAYGNGIVELELDQTQMGQAWIESAHNAVENPVFASVPFEETVVLDPRTPDAVGFRFAAARGRRIEISVTAEHDRYFADLMRVPEDPDDEMVHVASRPENGSRIEFESRTDGDYILRVQPELLRGGEFTVQIVARASLSFPVEGADPGDILSFFGDPRDGGNRLHHGVDVFAPRGTPVLAVSESQVVRVGERDLGGNVVILRDEARDVMVYYAHLTDQLVRQGQTVTAGDPVGTVGNTGNARTTPPHLHIGLYQGSWRRPVDPWDFFVDPPAITPPPVNHSDLLGTWAYIPGRTVVAMEAPREAIAVHTFRNRNPLLSAQGAGDDPGGGGNGPALESGASAVDAPDRFALPPGYAVQIVGAAGTSVRIRTPGGSTGYLEPAMLTREGQTLTLHSTTRLRDPATGDTVRNLAAGDSIYVIGETGKGRLGLIDQNRPVLIEPAIDPET